MSKKTEFIHSDSQLIEQIFGNKKIIGYDKKIFDLVKQIEKKEKKLKISNENDDDNLEKLKNELFNLLEELKKIRNERNLLLKKYKNILKNETKIK